MDRYLATAARTFKAIPSFENFRIWFNVSKRAGIPIALDNVGGMHFSAFEVSIKNFILLNVALSIIYQRTQLACSNILSAEAQYNAAIPESISQAVNRNFASAIWLESGASVLPRRWFWCPLENKFVYYFSITADIWDADRRKSIGPSLIFIDIPYTSSPDLLFPFERCYCRRQTFLVEMQEEGITESLADADLTVHLDCFNTNYEIEEEHEMTFKDFSLEHQFDLFEQDLSRRLWGLSIVDISSPSNSIELPIS